MSVAIFGAGTVGREAYRAYILRGEDVRCFIDNNRELWGRTHEYGIPIISLDTYIKENNKDQIVVAAQYKNQKSIEEQLISKSIDNYRIFDLTELFQYGRITSYSDPRDKEDVILWHLFKNDKSIFYIDVGSNDPFRGSVTKLFYDCKLATGINIDPQPNLIEVSKTERPRDISIWAAVGNVDDKSVKLYLQGGGSTLRSEYSVFDEGEEISVPVVSLKTICDKYVSDEREISFLKIDAEGSEREVLLGMDFSVYRPEIIVIESTEPRTLIPSFDKWEEILLNNSYEYLFSYGINRYYVSSEKKQKFEDKVKDIPDIDKKYNIYSAFLVYSG